MPGLLRGVARTAAVVGTATAVSNRVSRRQANRWSKQQDAQYAQAPPQPQQPQYYEAPPPPPPAAAPGADMLTQLQQLGDLKAQGILTDAEFETQKARILAS